MVRMRSICRLALLLALALGLLATARLRAEEKEKKPFQLKPKLANPLGDLSGFGGDQAEGRFDVSARFQVQKGTHEGRLLVKGEIEPGWHVYSVTQKKGGPMASKLTLDPLPGEAGYEITGPTTSKPAPHVRHPAEFKVPVEEHEGEVTWTVPLKFGEKADVKTLEIKGFYSGQKCTDGGSCWPIDKLEFTAKYDGEYEAEAKPAAEEKEPVKSAAAAKAEPYQPEFTHATVRGEVSAAVVPGGKATLTLHAEPEALWHVYAFAPQDTKEISKPTLFTLSKPQGWKVTAVTASAEPTLKPAEKGLPASYYYTDPVTWTVELAVPADAKAGPAKLAGGIGLQTCSEAQCDRPTGLEFAAEVTVAEAVVAGGNVVPLAFSKGDYNDVAKAAEKSPAPVATFQGKTVGYAGVAKPTAPASGGGFDVSKLKVQDDVANYPLSIILPIAFVGGFILNFMPCVLPVVGLKILSFVNQAGSHKSRIFALNLAYAVGMLAVFLVLATLAVVLGLGWGQQFNYEAFNITLAAVVFAMALSFLGVWEIPVPGFVGSEKAGDLAQMEGYTGAIFKGMLTTVLATPCSGPGLATALAWSANKPPHLVYLVFFVIGLGMAFPYLVIGLNPRLLRWLPKPGAWMDTFKQAMGFVLLGTVVYLFTFIPVPFLVPTFALLMGLWAACWWFGRIDPFAEFDVRLRGWIVSGTIALAVGWFAFGWLARVTHERFEIAVDRVLGERSAVLAEKKVEKPTGEELAWQPYSQAKLEALLAEKKTVMVDFTADWCFTCKTLEATVLNTNDVRATIERQGVVPLVADWTTRDPQMTELLTVLAGRPNVPVLAIFPASRPNEPIVITGGYTKASLLAKLEEAAKPTSDVAMSEGR